MKHSFRDLIATFLTLFLLIAGFPAALFWGMMSTVGDQARDAALRKHLNDIGKILSQTLALARPQEALEKRLQQLTRHPFPSPAFFQAAARLAHHYPQAIELFLADPSGKPISAEGLSLAPRVALEGIVRQLTTGTLPSSPRFIESFLGPNRLVRRLATQEGRLLNLQPGPQRNWGFWARLRDSNRTTNGYLLAFVRRQGIDDARFFREAVEDAQRRFGRHYELGWLDPTDPHRLYPTGKRWPAGLVTHLRRIPWGQNQFVLEDICGMRQFAPQGEIIFGMVLKERLFPVWPRQMTSILQIWLLFGFLGVGWGTFFSPPRWGLRPKLIALLGAGAGIPLLLLLWTGFVDRRVQEENILASLERDQEEQLNQIDRDLHESMSSLIDAYRRQKEVISSSIASGSGIPSQFSLLLQEHRHLMNQAAIIGSSGAILFHQDFAPLSSPAVASMSREVLRSLLHQLLQRHNGEIVATGTLAAANPIEAITGGTMRILWKRILLQADRLQNVNMLQSVLPSFLAPILDRQGRAIAMIAVMHLRRELQAGFLRQLFRHRLRPAPLAARLFAVPTEGESPWPIFPASGVMKLPGLEEQVRLARETRLPNHHQTTWRGRRYLVSVVPGQNLDGYVLGSAQPLDALRQQTHELATRLTFLVCGALALAMGGAWLASRLLLQPVQNLASGLARLQKRVFTNPVPEALVQDLSSIGTRLNRHFEDLQDLQVARSVQEQLWPLEPLAGPGWSLSGQCRTAADLGGDHHDWLMRPDGKICLVIGDVAGHGIPSALVAAAAKVFLCLLAEREEDPGEILHGINLRFLEQVQKSMPMTMWLGLFDPARRRLKYANAGHCYPVLCQGDQPFRLLGRPGLPLGISKRRTVVTEEVELSERSLVCLYTDGLAEAHSASQGIYSLPRLHDLISREREGTSQELFDTVFQDTRIWSGKETPEDDQTLLLLQVEKPS